MLKMFTLFAVTAALLVGCDSTTEVTIPSSTSGHSEEKAILPERWVTERFEITRHGIFRDGLAYDNKRAIYTIVDKDTGKEYIGLSGIGISELGSHNSGKTTVSDER